MPVSMVGISACKNYGVLKVVATVASRCYMLAHCGGKGEKNTLIANFKIMIDFSQEQLCVINKLY